MDDLHYESVDEVRKHIDDYANAGYRAVLVSYVPTNALATLVTRPFMTATDHKSVRDASRDAIAQGRRAFVFAVAPTKAKKSA